MTAATPHPIPLALVITELEPGGAEQCLVRLATGLDRARFSPTVYTLAPRPSAERSALVQNLETARVPVHFLGATRSWHYWRTRRRLIARLRETPATVMQTFLFHANVLGASAARRVGVPHVFAGLRVAEPSPWRWRMERRALAGVQGLVCVSRRVEQLARTHGLPSAKLVTIPNGMDLAAYPAQEAIAPLALGFPADAKLLVAVGRLERQKGFDFLIAAAPRIFAALPRHRLVIVGEGPERLRLERLCERYGVTDQVHLVGYLTDVPAILRAADLFLLTSRYEGFANVLGEALASGLPFVALPSAAGRDDLGSLAMRQVVANRDPADFIALVVSLATHRDLAQELGAQNRRFAEENLSSERMLAAYQNLWEAAARGAR